MSPNEIEEGAPSFRGPVVDQRVRRWSGSDLSITIDYVSGILDEIAGYAEDGLQRLQRGGIEVGGILFGSSAGPAIRVEAWRPIPCEHAQGPAFILSTRDQENLGRHLARFEEDSVLAGLTPVGWFVSHTRSEVALTGNDIEIYDRFFPEKEQIALVLKPARGAATRAGFFFRETGGRLRSDASHFEFSVESPVLPRPSRPGARFAPPPDAATALQPYRPRTRSGRPPASGEPEVDVHMARPDNVFSPRASTRGWKFATAVATLIAACSLAFAYYTYIHYGNRAQPLVTAAEFLGLNVSEDKGVVKVEWNRAAPAVAAAATGRVIVTENDAPAEYQLTADELKLGNYLFVRTGEDVRVRLTAYKKGGAPLADELARFIGPPVPVRPMPEPPVTPGRGDVKKLRESLEKEKARANAAEDLARIYKNRLELSSKQ